MDAATQGSRRGGGWGVKQHAPQVAYKDAPTCTKCSKEAWDHCRYFLCKHVLCIECDLTHEQSTCDAPSYLRMERDAITKARDIQDAAGGGG